MPGSTIANECGGVSGVDDSTTYEEAAPEEAEAEEAGAEAEEVEAAAEADEEEEDEEEELVVVVVVMEVEEEEVGRAEAEEELVTANAEDGAAVSRASGRALRRFSAALEYRAEDGGGDSDFEMGK